MKVTARWTQYIAHQTQLIARQTRYIARRTQYIARRPRYIARRSDEIVGLAVRRRVVQLALGEAQLTSVQRPDALRLLPHALLGEVPGSVVTLI